MSVGEAFAPKDLLSVRAVFTDYGPDYCDEECVWQNMWGVAQHPYDDWGYEHAYDGNISGMLHKASYGRLSWPPERGRVLSVANVTLLNAAWACCGMINMSSSTMMKR